MERSRQYIIAALISIVIILMMIVPENHGEREGFFKTMSETMQIFRKFNAFRRKTRNTMDSTKAKMKTFVHKIKEPISGVFS